jgi:8-oxo-dGTP pyrophosphatase MutT (NUDIX family)
VRDVTRIHIATVLARTSVDGADCVLLVASRYPNQPQPLWNLPGGRQLPGELLAGTAARELFEETGVRARTHELAYVSESYDGDVHVLNATFVARIDGASTAIVRPSRGDHVEDVDWVPLFELPSRIAVAVVREPLVAYLQGRLPQRYAGFHDAGITIQWPDDCS